MHRAPVKLGHERTWRKVNIPIFLDGIVLIYLLYTLFMLGDGAIRARNPGVLISSTSYKSTRGHAKAFVDHVASHTNNFVEKLDAKGQHSAQTVPSPPPLAFQSASSHPVGNAWADMLLMLFPNSDFLMWLHGVPDIVVAVVAGGLTLAALHTAALGDPGIIPRSWADEAREWRRQSSIANNAAAATSVIDMSKVADNSVGSPTAASTTPGAAAANGDSQSPTQQQKDEEGMGSPVASPATLGTAPPLSPGNEPPAPGWTYCDRCDLWRPARGHHEKVTNKCVLRLDHFCGWVDNTVAYRNHKCFFLFLVYILTCINHFWFMFVRFFFAESLTDWFRGGGYVGTTVLLMLYTFIVFATTGFAAAFLVSTFFNMLWDQTTLDVHIRNMPRFRGTGPAPKVHRVPTDSDDEFAVASPRDAQGRILPPPPKACPKRWLYAKPRRWYKNLASYLGPWYLWPVPSLIPMSNPAIPAAAGSSVRARDM